MGRGGLLSAIQAGKPLKKVETKDTSIPKAGAVIDGPPLKPSDPSAASAYSQRPTWNILGLGSAKGGGFADIMKKNREAAAAKTVASGGSSPAPAAVAVQPVNRAPSNASNKPVLAQAEPVNTPSFGSNKPAEQPVSSMRRGSAANSTSSNNAACSNGTTSAGMSIDTAYAAGLETRLAALESKIDKFMRHFGVAP
jgi:hypothetical protein